MMGRDFLLPDLGEGLTEAAIVSWLVSPGDTIAIDQPVVEVESAKSIVELPSPFGGVVSRLFGEVGAIIHAGQVLLTVTDAAVAETSGAVLVGYGTSESARPLRRPAEGRFGRKAPGRPKTPSAPAVAPVVAAAVAPLETERRSPVVSPLVRRLARENGFDATRLNGSGPQSLVLRSDVEAYIRSQAAAAAAALTTPPPAPAAAPVASVADVEDIRIPITGLRKVVSQRMTLSRREIPEATVWMDVDATELFAARDTLLGATGWRFSVTALIARFVVSGLRKYPLLNSSVDTASQEILQHGAINLGIAAQTPRGLMVPVVHGAHAMTTRQLRDAIAGLVAQSADGSFAPGTLTGGTFTLNNFGALGVDGSAAIINHPEAAILGIGRMIERPWVVSHELAVRTVVELSLVFDHRVCDGGTAAGFLTHIARCIESPVSLLADL
jgi:pyruvate/2-oxoglutarate dehydrogenase complex dihydrolipoamide acyltransferase (E2) component